MRPVYVCQLPDKVQEELRGILERILLYHCGSVEKAEEYFGTSLEEAVQNGMDSKNIRECSKEEARLIEENFQDVINLYETSLLSSAYYETCIERDLEE